MIVFENLFKETKGQKIVYNSKELVLLDRIEISNYTKIKIRFKEVNSDWRQGVVLATKGHFAIEDSTYANSIVLWQDTAPKEVNLNISTKSSELLIYNVWDVGNGIKHYWHNGAAMHIVQEQNKRTYFCNDGYPDDDLNDLIFSIIVD